MCTTPVPSWGNGSSRCPWGRWGWHAWRGIALKIMPSSTHSSPGTAAKGLRRPGYGRTDSRRRRTMWNNGTNDDPGWPPLNNGAYDPWREARHNVLIFGHRQREQEAMQARAPHATGTSGAGLGVLAALLLLLIGGSALVGMRGLLAGHGVQALLLSVIGLCWLLGRRQRVGWRWLWRQVSRGRPLLLVLVLGGLLTGCGDTMKGLAKTMYNVDYDAMQSPQPRK